MKRDGGLRELFRERLPVVHWTSIETGSTGRGIPDSNACYMGKEWWIEFKFTKGFAVALKPEQVGWLLQRTRAGGRTFIAVRRKAEVGVRRGEACDELWLLPGREARTLKVAGLAEVPPLGRWVGGPSAWGWSEILQLLLA